MLFQTSTKTFKVYHFLRACHRVHNPVTLWLFVPFTQAFGSPREQETTNTPSRGNEIITYLHNKVILAKSVQHVTANPTLVLLFAWLSAAAELTTHSTLHCRGSCIQLFWLSSGAFPTAAPPHQPSAHLFGCLREASVGSAMVGLLTPTLWGSGTSSAQPGVPSPTRPPPLLPDSKPWLRCAVPHPGSLSHLPGVICSAGPLCPGP